MEFVMFLADLIFIKNTFFISKLTKYMKIIWVVFVRLDDIFISLFERC